MPLYRLTGSLVESLPDGGGVAFTTSTSSPSLLVTSTSRLPLDAEPVQLEGE